jgi:hypothetical protein
MIFVRLAAITYLAVRLRRRSKLAARLVAFDAGHKKERIMNTPVLLLWLLALGLLAGGVQALVRADDGTARSEADMKEDVKWRATNGRRCLRRTPSLPVT